MKRIAPLLLSLVVAACSAAPPPVETSPVDEPVAEPSRDEPLPAYDPFNKRLMTFEATYAVMACKANINYDPDASVLTLREPFEWLLEIKDDKMSTTRKAFEELAQKQGYENIDAFVKEKEYIDSVKPTWFEDRLTSRLLDMVEECRK